MNVEAILSQIRERVISDENAHRSETGLSQAESSSNGSAVITDQDALSQIDSQLAITGRAWDQLPPVHSNRHGLLARIELWIKKAARPLTRWFTWEQVNFNRAVNDALRELVEAMRIEAEEFAKLRAQIATEMHQSRSKADLHDAQLRDLCERIDGDSGLLAEHLKLAEQVVELAASIRAAQQGRDEETDRRLAQLVAELKDEQRVCFRQLSLEASESAVLEDRARRSLLSRLEKLEAALKSARD